MFFSKTAILLPQVKALPHFRLFSDIRQSIGQALIFSKVLLVTIGVMSIFGFQPTLDFPPIKKAVKVVHAFEETVVSVPTVPFQLPHPGYISTHFSYYHPGIDIATGLGMPIRPVAPGTVLETTIGYFGLGHYTVVEHADGFRSTYGHMGRVYVKVGDTVKETTVLGEVGMTGRTSGPHTHLEVTKNGSYVNPLSILPELPNWPDPATYQGPGPVGGNLIKSAKAKVEEKRELNLKKELKFTL